MRAPGDRSIAVTDVVCSLLLSGLAVIGFDSSFGGAEAFTVGLPAVACGVAIGCLLVRLRPPLIVGCAIGAAAFFLLGGSVALRADAALGILPSPAAFSALADGALHGWARLLTTVPPAGEAGNLLAIPYLAGFGAGALSIVLAALVARWPICVVPPAAVLATAVLFGVDEPASLLLQGAAFGAVGIAWLSIRHGMSALSANEQRSGARVVGGAVLLAATVAAAFLVGPRLPLADANDRFILRDRVQPPFDPSQYPSPLTRYRRFDGPKPVTETLLVVEGLPAGERVRFAVMDLYDGYVWRASPPSTGPGGTYRRVGDVIPGAEAGSAQTVTFEMGALSDPTSVWVPSAGSPRAVRFEGPRGADLTEAFRFNRNTESVASPLVLEPGDRWEVDAVFASPSAGAELAELPVAFEPEAPTGSGINADVTSRVSGWTSSLTSPYEKVLAISSNLRDVGAYNDGSAGLPPIQSGHSLSRLVPFLADDQPQGNGEQYAAAVAYLAQSIGIPARVVLELEGHGPERTELTAEDVTASVEIALAGAGWVPVGPVTPDEDDVPTPQEVQQDLSDRDEVQPPPPTTVPPPRDLPEEPEADEESSERSAQDGSNALAWLLTAVKLLAFASVPVLLVLGPALVVLVLKARRRRRRQSEGVPAVRIVGGWLELEDLARDLGASIPPRSTRREAARFTSPEAQVLAGDIDAAVFGSVEPDDTVAESVWRRAREIRRSMLADLSRRERWKAAVSLTSMRDTR